MNLAMLKVPQVNLATAISIGLQVPEFSIRPRGVELKISGEIDSEVTFTAWWNGKKWELCTASIHSRSMFNGDQGPALEANLVTLFPMKFREIPIKAAFAALGREIAKGPRFCGLITIDMAEVDGKLYYQNIGVTINPDEYYGIKVLAGEDPCLIAAEQERPKMAKKFYASARIYSYPYEKDHNFSLPLDIDGEDGVFKGLDSYIIGESGQTIASAWRKLMFKANRICPPEACYRTDGEVIFRRAYRRLKEGGLI